MHYVAIEIVGNIQKKLDIWQRVAAEWIGCVIVTRDGLK